jgi:hypothetical protein
MRKLIITAMAASAAMVLPAPASADAKSPSVCSKAYNVRVAVVKKFGKRAPGRNICRYGVKHSNGKVRPAKYSQKKRYLFALRRLNTNLPMMYAGSPKVAPAATATPRAGGHLAAIRACESGGNYSTNTGNGFYGAYQFDMSTWASVGGTGNPANASPAEQDKRAAILYSRRGAQPWPVCGR